MMLGQFILTFVTPLWSTLPCDAALSTGCILSVATAEAEAITAPAPRIESLMEVAAAALAADRRVLSDRLLDDIEKQLKQSKPDETMLRLRTNLATLLAEVGHSERALKHSQFAQAKAELLRDESKRWDMMAKLAVVEAKAGDIEQAVDRTLAFPEGNDNLAAFKARALHDIAPVQARELSIEAARDTLAKITMGLTYYRAAAATDVAVAAHGRGDTAAVAALMDNAYSISLEQNDGYFKAGALRHVAEAYASIGSKRNAEVIYEQALVAAESAQQPQQRARAVSRIATSMSDQAMFVQSRKQVIRAIELAHAEPAGLMRWWALYEIAGSAAFAGDFETADQLLLQIPATAQFGNVLLRAVVRRDIAWGMARHGKLTRAYQLATKIHSSRERVQALSRMVLVLAKPKMAALPRYL